VSDTGRVLADADQAIEDSERVQRRAARRFQPRTACPVCGCRKSKIVDPRGWPEAGTTYSRDYRRVRECSGCQSIYLTSEHATQILASHKTA
jgi:uncharacterized protein with PIN domain